MATTAKILLVDDERAFVAALAQRLTARKYSVTCAYSGKEAIARLTQDQDIEVIILDIKMPGLDGIETLKLIKARWPSLEVILLTAFSTVASAINAIKLGAFDYLVKPAEMKQLVSKIEKAASRKRYREELIREVYATPYLTQREQQIKIARILDAETKSRDE